VVSGKRGFLNPTSKEVMDLLDIGTSEGEVSYSREYQEGPAPDEWGEMVHRAMEGIPVERIAREYGYPGSVKDIQASRSSLLDQVSKLGVIRSFKEIELVSRINLKGMDHDLKGRLDLMVEKDDGTLLVIDFKTGRKRPEHEAQLEAYRSMLQVLTGKKVDVLVLTP
jgi:ATP-dependent exoDNAse (exonuclease V) beta subunit